jgi:S1 RNA binding domain protein
MPVEVGQVVKGTITGVKKFGAFIKLPDGKTGLCHISEVSDQFIKDIETFLTMNQEVEVKVIGIDGTGKINLSIKQAQNPETASKPVRRPQSRPQSRPPVKKDIDSLIDGFMKESDEKLKTIKNKKSRKGNGYHRK